VENGCKTDLCVCVCKLFNLILHLKVKKMESEFNLDGYYLFSTNVGDQHCRGIILELE
jgi:hypothetical protein